jgi:hypothetical protein
MQVAQAAYVILHEVAAGLADDKGESGDVFLYDCKVVGAAAPKKIEPSREEGVSSKP